MKVLHLIDSGGLYGAEKMLLSLVEEQLKQGLDPMVLSAGEPGIHEKSLEKEARIRGLPVTRWRMKSGFNFSESLKILKWAKKQNIDVLHSHGYKFNILLGVIPRRWRRIPMVTTVHGYVHARRFTKMWMYELLDRIVIRFMDRIVIVSGAMKTEVSGKATLEKSYLIPNGIDIEATKNKANEEPDSEVAEFLSRQKSVVLGVGRLSPEKGFDTLLETFSRFHADFPNSGLLILGEGRQKRMLLELAAKYELGNKLLLAGFIDNVPSVMARSDCLVMPSKTEGMPITVLEAMTVGLPVIAFGVGGLPELLEQGKAGTLVESGQSDELIAAMNDCFNAEEETKRKVINAQSAVRAKYSTQAMSGAYLRIYRGIAD